MTPRERRALIIGILVGVIFAGTIAFLVVIRQTAPAETPAAGSPETAPSAALAGAANPRAVQLSSEEQAKIRLETTEVRREPLTEDILAIGRVEEPETAIRTVSTRFGGRIEQLFVKYVGQAVQKGQAVAIIQITGQPAGKDDPARVTVTSESTGIVRERKVAEGQFVNPGDTLINLTDLKAVWVKANVFDSDLPRIRPGIAATVTSEAMPGTKVSGRVDFIDAYSDPQTRTTPVRIQVDNPGTRLRPGMLVQAAFHISLGNVLAVPREAVLDSGTERIAYVARENGVFEQRRIQTGAPTKDRYPVTEGLKAGEKVVTSGVFLVDSQTRLTGGLTGMFGGSKTYSESGSPAGSAANGYKMTVRIDPDPPQGAKQNNLHVTLTDPSGKPVSDAQVRLTFTMPAMPAMNMPEMRNAAELKWTGSEYAGPITIMMAGGWNVSVEARRGNEVIATTQTHINAR